MTPRFKSHFRVERVGNDKIFFIGERDTQFLRNPLCAAIAPLIDGRHTVDELVAALDGVASPPEIFYALSELHERGYLMDVARDAPSDVFWLAQGIDTDAARARLGATPVCVDVPAAERIGVAAERLGMALEGAGVRVAAPEQGAIRLVVTDDYLGDDMARMHGHARAGGWAWVPIKPVGTEIWLGPIFQPGGPCWECLTQRMHQQRVIEAYVGRMKSLATPLTPPQGHLPSSLEAALHIAAVALARWIATGGGLSDAPARGLSTHTLVAIELGRLAMEPHPVVKLPQCASCGDPTLGPADSRTRPITLRSRPVASSEGGLRVGSTRQTYERLRKHVSPRTGLISSLTRLRDAGDELMPVYTAIYPACPHGPDAAFSELLRASWGKGTSAAEARVSALCEALERQSAMVRGDEPRVHARMSELDALAVAPGDMLLYSERQYRERQAINAGIAQPLRRVPVRFDPAWPIDWTPAWSLSRGALCYLPTALCYDGYSLPEEQRFGHFNSNGHAAGSCLEEAILQGLFELCERDAVALWWFNRARRPAVDMTSIDDDYVLRCRDGYQRQGFAIWALDLTTDLGIPAVAAVAMHDDRSRVAVGFGCHLSARIAVRRALTELGQGFVPSRPMTQAWQGIDIASQHYLFPDHAAPAVSDRALDRLHDLRDAVETCVARAAACGLEVIVLDQSRPDIELSVAKVVVPGLRHFWPRLAPGRLYDTPVALGWRDRPCQESETNPAPILW